MDENTHKDTTSALQERELKRLCDTGFNFSVTRSVQEKRSFFGRLLKRKTESKTEVLNFEVHQPTLATLDRMSVYMTRFHIREEEIANADDAHIMNVAKNSISEARNMAKILAIMVLGEDYYLCNGTGRCYKKNDAELDRLEEIFLNHITPKKLYDICNACLIVCNLADFMNSTRLMAAEETSQPRKNRVE